MGMCGALPSCGPSAVHKPKALWLGASVRFRGAADAAAGVGGVAACWYLPSDCAPTGFGLAPTAVRWCTTGWGVGTGGI